MEYLKVEKKVIKDRQKDIVVSVKHYEQLYQKAKEKEDEFYMKGYHIQINRLQAEYNTLDWVIKISEKI